MSLIKRLCENRYFDNDDIKEIDGKSGPEMQEMLWSKHNVNWNDYPNFFKRGTFILRRKTTEPFTTEELENLPPKHDARRNPGMVVERIRCVRYSDLPKFSTVLNRDGFLFRGEEPITAVRTVPPPGHDGPCAAVPKQA